MSSVSSATEAMDHEEPALNLSDVVHDHTIDDDDIDDSSIPEHISQSHHLPATSSLSPAHKHYHNSDLPSVNHQPLPVDILERELAALLNQDASDATAALLNAAAQQQAGVGLPSNSVIQPDDTTSIPGLEGLSITTLAAMLSAAHAQAELAAKNSDFAHQRADILPQKESQNTRTAPAFHSLTATESSHFHKPLRRRDRSSQSPDKSDYLYSDGHSDSDAESSTPTLMSRSPVDPGPPMTSSSLQEDFSDLNDILTQLSHFETDQDQSHDHGHPSPDTSPVVSRAHGSSQPASASLPHFPSPNRHPDPQPIASTSTATQQTKATQKKGKGNTPSASQAKKPPVDKPPSIPSHICEQPGCQKSFTRRSDLARHMRIHTGERPFVCEYADCGKTFIQRSALHVHARVHTGEKPHCCEYPGCNKTFSDSSSLARHRRTHTGKRPYKCDNDACTKTFTRRTTLNQHMKMSHNPDWSPDPAVRYDFKTKRRRVAEESDDEDDQTLEDSVRTISAIFHAGGASLNGPPGTVTSEQEEPLELRVASISAEIAAAIAQAHARSYEEEDEDDEVDELADDSGDELNSRDTIGPTTSGIRGRGGNQRTGGRDGSDRVDEDGERSLHLRGAEGELVAAGEKRKR